MVILEFGARSTGEPHEPIKVVCDMAGSIDGVSFPDATPLVMRLSRTFWEKATAVHAFCEKGSFRGERFSRHWHDLATISDTKYYPGVVKDREVAEAVARHKSFFFIEKDTGGKVINYMSAVSGGLKLVPDGEAMKSLGDDYAKMIEDGILLSDPISFNDLMVRCGEVEAFANG